MPNLDRFNDDAFRYFSRPEPMKVERNVFSEQLEEAGYQSGPVYATGILKGKTVRQTAADFRSQETIRPMTERILGEADG